MNATRSPLSPRQRRLRLAIVAISALAVLGGSALWQFQRRNRPSAYRPDEVSADITSSLARDLPPEAPRPRLTDVSRSSGLGDFRNFVGARTSQLPEDMGPGLAWGDFDNDGDDDLFLVGAGGAMGLPAEQRASCVLYENAGNGTFRPVSGFPETRIQGMGAAWGDVDGDGFLDLAVAGYDALRLFHNEGGTGRFTRDRRLPEPPGFWTSVAWGDFDGDRRLDLYVANYVRYLENAADRDRSSDQVGTAVPYTLNPASYEPGLNALFQQGADGTFSDAAARLGVQNPTGRSLGAVWHDFDQDGRLDLYVANDVSDNVLYRNVGGRFEDISHPAWVADYRSAMGLAIGDYDRDGDDDLHVTHWVAQENALYENMWADLRGTRVHASGPATPPPRLPSGPGTGSAPGTNAPVALRFVDIADRLGLGQIALPMVGWGTEFADLDHDGWLDLLVANGSTLEADGPRPRALQPQPSFLFWNRRGAHFHDLAPLHPGLAAPHVGRGLATADYDLDGDLDLALTDLGEGVRLYRNEFAQGSWLKLRLRSRAADGRAIGFGDGSTAIAWIAGVPLRRTVGGISYLSQSSHVLHWGLGTNAVIDRLEVRWLGGATSVVERIPAGRFLEWREDQPAPVVLERPTSAAPPPASSPSGGSASAALDPRQRTVEFWNRQRAAMNAMKVERDNRRAIPLFREALALNPAHEDSRYYLGLCLAAEGDPEGALDQLAELQRVNPRSHRAWQQWGVLRASFPRDTEDLARAEQAVAQAHALNPEETGALLILGEISLLRRDLAKAEERLAAATRTNPKAVGGFFLRGYLAWKRGDAQAATAFLEQTRQALGPDWTPQGTTSEGDVKRKQHVEASPLARHWESWNGERDPARAYAALARALE